MSGCCPPPICLMPSRQLQQWILLISIFIFICFVYRFLKVGPCGLLELIIHEFPHNTEDRVVAEFAAILKEAPELSAAHKCGEVVGEVKRCRACRQQHHLIEQVHHDYAGEGEGALVDGPPHLLGAETLAPVPRGDESGDEVDGDERREDDDQRAQWEEHPEGYREDSADPFDRGSRACCCVERYHSRLC